MSELTLETMLDKIEHAAATGDESDPFFPNVYLLAQLAEARIHTLSQQVEGLREIARLADSVEIHHTDDCAYGWPTNGDCDCGLVALDEALDALSGKEEG